MYFLILQITALTCCVEREKCVQAHVFGYVSGMLDQKKHLEILLQRSEGNVCKKKMAISYQWCFLLVGMVPWIMEHVCRSFGKQSWQLDRRPIDGDQTKPPRNAPWIQKVSFFNTFMSILGEKCSTMWMFSATVNSVISYCIFYLFLF